MYIISQNAFYFTNNVQQKQKQQQTLLFPSLTLPPNTSTGTSTDFQVHSLISSCYHAYLWSSLPKSYLTLIYTWTMHPPKVHTQKCQIQKHRQTSRSCGSDYFRPSYLIYGQSTLSESLNVSNAPPAIGIGLIGSLENASFNIILMFNRQQM